MNLGLNINKEINFAKFSNNNFNKSTELNSNKFKKKEQINNNTSKSISNINNNSIIIESINKIKAKIYNAINKNHYHNHMKNKRNKLFKLKRG